MKKRIFQFVFLLALSSSAFTLMSCGILTQATGSHSPSGDPTPDAINRALKEALNKGLSFAIDALGKKDGFLGDAAVKILFPSEAKFAADKLRQIGMGNMVDEFEVKMNRGAEEAVKSALPIFVDALTSMSIGDVKNVLLGNETAATDFFKQKTSDALYSAFAPRIKTSLDQVGAAGAWTKIASTYNAIPFVNRKVETDIVRYTTNRAMDGLFKKVAIQEMEIRQSPVFRTTSLLQEVFGYAARVKQGGAGSTSGSTPSGTATKKGGATKGGKGGK